MSALLVGYARCSTDQQDVTAQRDGLTRLGVAAERIYVDHGLTGSDPACAKRSPRVAPAIRVAMAKGHLRGEQPKLNLRQEAHLVSLVHSGQYSTGEVADLFGVGRSTVHRAIERQRNEARAGATKPPRRTEVNRAGVPHGIPLRSTLASRPTPPHESSHAVPLATTGSGPTTIAVGRPAGRWDRADHFGAAAMSNSLPSVRESGPQRTALFGSPMHGRSGR